MAITINGTSINFGTYSLELGSTGVSVSNSGSISVGGGFTVSTTPAQGSVYGYVSGGYGPNLPPVVRNIVERFPFSSPYTVSDIGDLTVARAGSFGHSSSTTGYTSSGSPNGTTLYGTTRDTFPFTTPFVTATSLPASPIGIAYGASAMSDTHGYSMGGAYSPPLTYYSSITRFPFASPTASPVASVGNLSLARSQESGHSSLTDGYAVGGITLPGTNLNTIDKFPFASAPTTVSDIGDLSVARRGTGSQSSAIEAFNSGGATPSSVNTIDKFPFSTPFVTATDAGDLSQSRSNVGYASSTSEGFTIGGDITNTIDKFPFSSPFTTASDVADLASQRKFMASQSY